MRSIFRYVNTRLSICTLYARSLIRQRETDKNTDREKKRDKEIKTDRDSVVKRAIEERKDKTIYNFTNLSFLWLYLFLFI